MENLTHSKTASGFIPEVFPVRISYLPLKGGHVRVLRDDYLSGGTKQRALRPFLLECQANGYEEFGYASPFSGFAQLALSYACAELGLRCRLFAEADPNISYDKLREHSVTGEARKAGAQITLTSSLDEAEILGSVWVSEEEGRYKLPLGLDCAEYRRHLKEAVTEVWNTIVDQQDKVPSRLWVSLGSGTLSSTLREVIPASTELCCINVHVLENSDPRIQRIEKLSNTKVYSAVEAFAEKCRFAPPIPSNLHYDAKVWQFLIQNAQPGDVWWNVAK